MPLFTTVRRVLPAVTLFITFAFGQTCWYPDGKTISSDIPCDASQENTACCSSQSFCIYGGLCLTGGIVTRGSCTDKTWGTDACAGFCKDVDTDGEVAITPCSSGISTNTFVCGLENDKCDDAGNTFTLSSETKLVLRPAQIQALVGPAIASGVAGSRATVTAPPTAGDGLYTTGTMVGAVFGVALPLIIALGAVLYLLLRERQRNNARASLYKISSDDDTKGSIMIRPAPSMLKRVTGRSSYAASKWSNARGSQRDSSRTSRSPRANPPRPLYIPNAADLQKPPMIHSPVASLAESQRSSHITSFAERVETMKVTPQLVDVRDSNHSRHELDSNPSTPMQSSPTDGQRFELATQRMSR